MFIIDPASSASTPLSLDDKRDGGTDEVRSAEHPSDRDSLDLNGHGPMRGGLAVVVGAASSAAQQGLAVDE